MKSAIKEVYGPSKPCTTPLLSVDGSTLLKKSSINVRWREHFRNLLNRPSTVDPYALDLIPQRTTVHCLDLPLQWTKSRRRLSRFLLTSIWEDEELPKDFRPCHQGLGPWGISAIQTRRLSVRRLDAKTKVVEKIVLEALFADDCTFMAHKESDLQLIVSKFAEASRLFGLTISLGKTEVLFQPSRASTAPAPAISIEGTQLKTVNDFRYLGTTISNGGSLDKEINARICKASQAIGRLRPRVLNQHNVQLSTKLKVYKAVVLTSLLYACGDVDHIQKTLEAVGEVPHEKPEVDHEHSLARPGHKHWGPGQSQMISIEAMILKAQLRWVGHVIRMDDHWLPKHSGAMGIGADNTRDSKTVLSPT
ncbi:uncharacterized protein LOC124270483 [Haliotis rubra]|uniref:uncharacterized protein LOC124270483 n=1 Tax=Haliotis rubra TaxID=36100 RepID=UPI001EE5B0F4|nr:uncharacterized protein LOC124270483 [Haliotis rubra]